MIALCLFACLALASAAPRFEFRFGQENSPFMRPPPPPPPHHHHHHHHDEDGSNLFGGDIFDTHRFWSEMETRMQLFDQMMSEFAAHFPTTTSQTGIQGNEYVVVVTLNGFEEKDIKVKAREGVLMVQAVQKNDDGSERSYLDLKTLPSNVNVNGTWVYNMGVLRITFPLKNTPQPVTEIVVETTTQGPIIEDRDREEMEETNGENRNHDADVGLDGVDRQRSTEIISNAIPSVSSNEVEATTYAVDLDNEVEFVPVKY